MPETDLRSLDSSYLLKNMECAFAVRNTWFNEGVAATDASEFRHRIYAAISSHPASISIFLLITLHKTVSPAQHFIHSVFDRFPGSITMRFSGQDHQPYSTAKSFQGMEHALGLQGKGSRIVISFSMNKEQRFIYLVNMHKGRHGKVDLWSLPEGPSFVLEPKGVRVRLYAPLRAIPAAKKSEWARRFAVIKAP